MTSAMAGLAVVLLLVLVQAISGQRIAEQKCAEFRTNPRWDCPSEHVLCAGGGFDAMPQEFPHHALLGWKNRGASNEYWFDCGGSLISERYVLTAAHCFRNGHPNIVRLGDWNMNDETDNYIDFKLEAFVKHPQYRYYSSYHDIALIKLDADVTFSEFIRPACLWTGMNLNVSYVIATGFGVAEVAGDRPMYLQKVWLDILDSQECQKIVFYKKLFKKGIMDSQLCVGSKSGPRDTCQGDSGGPIQKMIYFEKCLYHVIGVTSIGAACGVGLSASIYTRVASYIDWIEDIVWNNGLEKMDCIKKVKCEVKVCRIPNGIPSSTISSNQVAAT